MLSVPKLLAVIGAMRELGFVTLVPSLMVSVFIAQSAIHWYTSLYTICESPNQRCV